MSKFDFKLSIFDMKILISWVATMHDFLKVDNDRGNKINYDGPTFNFHREFYSHDRHIVLCKGVNQDPDIKVELLRTELEKEFNDHKIEITYLDVNDVIDIYEIKGKVESLLIRNYREDDIDIFFSPGTSAMQIAWYLIHESGILNTQLYQVRPRIHSKSGRSELLTIAVGKSVIPVSSVIKEESLSRQIEDYKITKSLEPIYNKARLIAAADQVTTLISGESGVGKEHLAHFVHKQSPRIAKPFIAVNCSAFTDELLLSRLFGHKKGSFTGANEDRKGFFEEAKGGTIFLDEIGDISPFMQQSLLRVLQEKSIITLGDNKEKKIDVRIVSATNKDLVSLCAEGKFRWDLYYRLTVTELSLPALRDRSLDDRKEMLSFFLKSKKKMFKRSKTLVLDKDVERIILNYPFLGNVRELENLIESLYVFSEEKATVESLPPRFLTPIVENKMDLKTVERLHVLKVINIAGSNAAAAKILGITINTLKAKIK
ncbi:sigma-54-dependent Fis family transcriptional regulator [Sphingobacterium multivorum]|uniref:Sigma-54-dependent Fis family transcriptional regulator n=1 Tax=Sphingobacterium multivorum TaxID=28454 RepID=A0ABX7CLY3_SPHMU|nr:sigma 54-interacting transcriptional regulator [Sphingobacterium multivorum]QQT52088.1 sigma-54-dependent Fis family transcriptional regulator [Sphingobacterium multivorum]